MRNTAAATAAKGLPVPATADDSRNVLPRFPLDMVDVDAAASCVSGRARQHLELVPESTGAMAAGTQDLFADDENDVALTEIHVRVTVAPPRDQESQRRFDAFWLAPALPEPEAPVVYRSVFPKAPFLQRPAVRTSLVCAAAIAFVAVWICSFVLVATRLVGSP
jgi:hypothetical protein